MCFALETLSFFDKSRNFFPYSRETVRPVGLLIRAGGHHSSSVKILERPRLLSAAVIYEVRQ